MAIIIFIASFIIFILGFQAYYNYTQYRLERGQNITSQETDTVLSFLKKVPTGLIIGYSAAITVIVIWILFKKHDDYIDTEKLKYK
jgi:formate hydrogenlyase subunit 3/multisubunit Na+/H+ antiporter MnhD subunit